MERIQIHWVTTGEGTKGWGWRSEISNAIARCRIFEENFVRSSVTEARAGAIV